MPSVTKRVHIIPTSLETERVGKIFDDTVPDKVYILYNTDPHGFHEDLNEEVLENARSVVREKTMCYDRESVEEEGIDFYHFNEALIDVYEIIYRESYLGNDIYVNLSGGTRPVAIALAFACSLAATGELMYYPAADYEENEGEVPSSTGVLDGFEVAPFAPLNMKDIIPSEDGQEELILDLVDEKEAIGITDLLIKMDKIASDPPEDEEEKSERSKKIQKYHRHARKMTEDELLDRENGNYELTETGRLIAKLIKVRQEVESKHQEES
jgi:hypothetical protein